MIVTLCGHREVANTEVVRAWLLEVLEDLIAQGATTFYLGNQGGFDRIATATLLSLRAKYTHIESVLILPYLDRKFNPKLYSDSLYPTLSHVPPRFAIPQRNRWMVSNAQVVVAYVVHNWGGASTMVALARRQGKRVVQYPQKALQP